MFSIYKSISPLQYKILTLLIDHLSIGSDNDIGRENTNERNTKPTFKPVMQHSLPKKTSQPNEQQHGCIS